MSEYYNSSPRYAKNWIKIQSCCLLGFHPTLTHGVAILFSATLFDNELITFENQ